MSYANHPDVLDREDRAAEATAEQEAESRAAEQSSLERSFLLAASIGDVAAPAAFAPRRIDATKSRIDGAWPMRRATVGEVLAEGFDYARGPTVEGDVMALLCRAARGEDVRADAKALLVRAAATWADMAVGS